jgi:hypothetical protein
LAKAWFFKRRWELTNQEEEIGEEKELAPKKGKTKKGGVAGQLFNQVRKRLPSEN